MAEPKIVEHVQDMPTYVRGYTGEDKLPAAFKEWIKDGAPMGYAPDDATEPAHTYLLDWWLGLVPVLVTIGMGLYAVLSAAAGLPNYAGLGLAGAVSGALSVFRKALPAHEAAHTGVFGDQFDELQGEGRSPDGGLNHVPMQTMDVMTPNGPRFRDPRGIVEEYKKWRMDGRIERRRGSA